MKPLRLTPVGAARNRRARAPSSTPSLSPSSLVYPSASDVLYVPDTPVYPDTDANKRGALLLEVAALLSDQHAVFLAQQEAAAERHTKQQTGATEAYAALEKEVARLRRQVAFVTEDVNQKVLDSRAGIKRDIEGLPAYNLAQVTAFFQDNEEVQRLRNENAELRRSFSGLEGEVACLKRRLDETETEAASTKRARADSDATAAAAAETAGRLLQRVAVLENRPSPSAVSVSVPALPTPSLGEKISRHRLMLDEFLEANPHLATIDLDENREAAEKKPQKDCLNWYRRTRKSLLQAARRKAPEQDSSALPKWISQNDLKRDWMPAFNKIVSEHPTVASKEEAAWFAAACASRDLETAIKRVKFVNMLRARAWHAARKV